jgi:riboflavin synthase
LFTGLVAEKGVVEKIAKSRFSAVLTLRAQIAASGLEIGESIAVNGVCLTVTAFDSGTFTVDVMLETLRKTNLGLLQPGSRVNLERALRLGDRLGGHLVTGHIDGTGVVARLKERGIATEMWVEVPPELEKYLVPRGSVALDGVSLTIADLRPGALMVSLIPHTKEITTLGEKKIGDILNIETDILGKYVHHLLSGRETSREGITEGFLAEHGFL